MESTTVKCPACGYEWVYKGKKLAVLARTSVYVTCPTCRHNVKIEAVGE